MKLNETAKKCCFPTSNFTLFFVFASVNCYIFPMYSPIFLIWLFRLQLHNHAVVFTFIRFFHNKLWVLLAVINAIVVVVFVVFAPIFDNFCFHCFVFFSVLFTSLLFTFNIHFSIQLLVYVNVREKKKSVRMLVIHVPLHWKMWIPELYTD